MKGQRRRNVDPLGIYLTHEIGHIIEVDRASARLELSDVSADEIQALIDAVAGLQLSLATAAKEKKPVSETDLTLGKNLIQNTANAIA